MYRLSNSPKVIQTFIKWGEAGFELGQSNSRTHAFNYYARLSLQKINKNFMYILITVTLFLKYVL